MQIELKHRVLAKQPTCLVNKTLKGSLNAIAPSQICEFLRHYINHSPNFGCGQKNVLRISLVFQFSFTHIFIHSHTHSLTHSFIHSFDTEWINVIKLNDTREKPEKTHGFDDSVASHSIYDGENTLQFDM